MDKIYINYKNRYSLSGYVPSTNTNNLSDYAGGHEDPEIDYDFESELNDLNE